MTYKYIVWVGGVDDYYTNLETAFKHYEEWIKQGYDQLFIEEIETGRILRKTGWTNAKR